MNYFIALIICSVLSFAAAFGLYSFDLKIKIKYSQGKLYLAAAFLLFFISYSFLACWKYDNLWFGLWDLGIFDSMIYKMSRFDAFMEDFRGGFDHFSPLTVLFVPLYWIFDSPKILLWAQSFLLAAAAVPLFYCAKSKLNSNFSSLIVAGMYLLNPLLSRFALFEFHIECLFPLIFFSAWYFYEQKKYNWFIAVLLLGVFAKEDFLIAVIASGIYLFAVKKYKLGATCFIATGILILFILYIWFPYVINYSYYHQSRYLPLFDRDILVMTANAFKFAAHAVSTNSLGLSLSLLLAFAFLPVFAPRELICFGIPVLFVHFASIAPHQQLLMSHYSIEADIAFPLIAIYGFYNARRMFIKKRKLLKYIYCFSFVAPICSHIMFCELPNKRYYTFIPEYNFSKHLGILSIPFNTGIFSEKPNDDFHEIIKVIPTDFSVTVQNNLGCQFLRHKKVNSLREPSNPDAYLFHVKRYHRFDPPDDINNKIKFLLKNKSYKLILNHNGLLIFVKKSRLKDLKTEAITQ